MGLVDVRKRLEISRWKEMPEKAIIIQSADRIGARASLSSCIGSKGHNISILGGPVPGYLSCNNLS